MGEKMSGLRGLKHFLTLAAFAGLLAGCQTAAPGGVSRAADPRGLFIDDPQFANLGEERMRFRDAWQTEEYIRYEGTDVQAELIYAAAVRYDYVSLEFPFTLNDTFRQWRFLDKGFREIGKEKRTNIALFDVRYRRFQTSDTSRFCFGFTAEGHPKSDDPTYRPTRVVWGYVCEARNKLHDDARIEDFIFSIDVIADRAADPAKSSGSLKTAPKKGNRGNSQFPLDLARYYQLQTGAG